MADEYIPYLDPDYVPDLGDDVNIYVGETLGLLFSLDFSQSDIVLLISPSDTVPGLSIINLVFNHPLVSATFARTLLTMSYMVQ